MSTLKADAVTTKSDNTDLTITGGGSGVPNLETGFKVGGTAGVPVTELRTGTDGELITWDASGDPATVAVGTSTHVLTSNGAGAAPTFQAAAGGGAWTFINKTTVSAAALFSITGFTNTYDHHVLVIPGCQASDSIIEIQLSTDAGVSYETGSNYAFTIQGNAANSGTFSTERSTATTYWEIGRGIRGVYPVAYIAEIHLFGMAQTVYYTTYQGLWSGGGTSAQVTKGGPMLGCMLTTGAWNALKIFNATYTGDVYLYGVSQA
jgi:hypothetical protein